MDIGWTWGSTEALAGLAVLVDAAVKGTVLLGLAWGVTLVLRRKSAAVRHWVWMMAVGGLAVLPVLGVLLPGWGVLPRFSIFDSPGSIAAEGTPRPSAESQPPRANLGRYSPPGDFGATEAGPVRMGATSGPMDDGSAAAAPIPMEEGPASTPPVPTVPAPSAPAVAKAVRTTLDGASVVLAVWAAGVVAMLVPIVVGMAWLRRMRRTGMEATDGARREMQERLAAAAGVKRKVGLWRSARCLVPLTYGLWRPVIVLPAEALTWPEERRRMALLHELAHIRRWDCLTQMLVRCLRAAYWFHPLAWLAAARAQAECERACDDRVLTAGTKGSTYAAALMEYAAPLAGGGPSVGRRCYVPTGALAMARASTLEGRLLAILDGRANRRPLTCKAAAAALLVLAAISVPLACMREATGASTEIAPATPATQATDKSAAVIESRVSDVVPAEGTWYVLEGNGLYQSPPVLAELGPDRAYAKANEFVYRTGLRKLYRLPAFSTGQRGEGYGVQFEAISGSGSLQVLVSADGTRVKIEALAVNLGAATAPATTLATAPAAQPAAATTRAAAENGRWWESQPGWSEEVGGLKVQLTGGKYLTPKLGLGVQLSFWNKTAKVLAIAPGDPACVKWEVRDEKDKLVPPDKEEAAGGDAASLRWMYLSGNQGGIGRIMGQSSENKDGILHVGNLRWKLAPGAYSLHGTFTAPPDTQGQRTGELWQGKIDLVPLRFTVLEALTRADLLAEAAKVKGQFADLGKRYAALAALIQAGMTKDDLLAVLPPTELGPELWYGNFVVGRYSLDGGYGLEYQGTGQSDAKGSIQVVLSARPRILSPEDFKAMTLTVTTANAPSTVTRPATTRADAGVDATRAATQPGLADPVALLNQPRITMSVEKGSLDDVTAALTKATGIVFSVQPGQPASTFTVNAKDQPLWEIIRDLSAPSSLQYLPAVSGVRLVPQAGGPVPQVAGPLIIYARLMTNGEVPRDTVGRYYRLTAFADPRLYLVAGSMDFTQATDSLGNKLAVLESSQAAGGSRGSVGPRDEARVNQLLWELGVTLPADSKGKVNLKGTARLLLVDKFATRTVEEPEKHLGEAMELGGRKVTITQFGTTVVGRAPSTQRVQCQVNVEPAPVGALPAPPDINAATGTAGAWFARYTVLDATGRALANETAPTPSNRLMAAGQGPYRIVISAPLTWKAVTVPVELKGLEGTAAALSK